MTGVNWYKAPIDDYKIRCIINDQICTTDFCKSCSIAVAYESSTSRKWGRV